MSKRNFQIFTPSEIATDMLDRIGYISDLRGKKILENSCGEGNILEIIVRRYIEDSLTQHVSLNEIKRGLSEDIVAYEVDESLITKCQEKLHSVASEYGVLDVTWQLLKEDYLFCERTLKYNYIVGNPPYISYGIMDEETRVRLKEKFKSCEKGPNDYCYAFIEASIDDLMPEGRMAYLIPSSIFKTRFAQSVRELVLPHLTDVYDYSTIKIFSDALTSSAVIITVKDSNIQSIAYNNISSKSVFTICKADLQNKWIFEPVSSVPNGKQFGDYFSVCDVIATQANDVFVISDYSDNGDYIETNGFRIEKELLRRAYSPKCIGKSWKKFIVFPYSYNDCGLLRFNENEFRIKYPEALHYLESNRKRLDARKAETTALWFEYGRSQALAHLNQPKLMVSKILTGKLKAYVLGQNDIPYSGLYVVQKGELSLSKAKQILESESFEKHLRARGIHINGHSIRFVAEDVKSFSLS